MYNEYLCVYKYIKCVCVCIQFMCIYTPTPSSPHPYYKFCVSYYLYIEELHGCQYPQCKSAQSALASFSGAPCLPQGPAGEGVRRVPVRNSAKIVSGMRGEFEVRIYTCMWVHVCVTHTCT